MDKPAFGSPCNGCGYCCQQARCRIAVQVVGEGPGPCPMLQEDDKRTYCGLLRTPEKYISPLALFALKRSGGVGAFQSELAFILAIGSGCDSDDPS